MYRYGEGFFVCVFFRDTKVWLGVLAGAISYGPSFLFFIYLFRKSLLLVKLSLSQIVIL